MFEILCSHSIPRKFRFRKPIGCCLAASLHAQLHSSARWVKTANPISPHSASSMPLVSILRLFASARHSAGKTGKPKDTLLNILETKECTVSIISYDMVHQASLASAPFEYGVDEFVKAGFTKLPSQKVKPFGVAESPFVMEAKLLKHVEFGGKPGSANMLICEVLMIHIREDVLNEKGSIDPRKIDQVARMGGVWYARAAQGLFELPQPSKVIPGFDLLSDEIRKSPYLSGHDIARLLDVEEIPALAESTNEATLQDRHLRAKELIENDDIEEAWKILMS